MTLKALIVDDEELCVKELYYILEGLEDIQICGTAFSGKEAIELCQKHSPDVVFLDIRMHDMNGFQVAEKLYEKQISPKIIFVTAYDEYALKAFEINALDYVLKPFSETRIKKTVERVKELLENRKSDPDASDQDINSIAVLKGLKKIAVEKNSRLILIDYTNIILVEADGKKTLIRTKDNIYKSDYSLKDLEEKLKPYFFFKPHRSYLVNLKKIKEIIPWFNGTYKIIMEHCKDLEIHVTRKNVKCFKKLLGM